MDIRKRIYPFPKMGAKASFIAVPTTAGTGSEVTPFAVITDDATGIKYPLADYALMPDIAIVDIDYMMDMPKGLTAASGIDTLTHALEAYASMLATDFTDGLALTAIKNVFKYLPVAYNDGKNEEAREKMANAASIAGMAFANAFLGICHSMAHKLGAYFHLPHGVANALIINAVIAYNAVETPKKMGAFSQYKYPKALERYGEIASFVGIDGKDDGEKVVKLIEKIDALKEAIGIKKTIKDYDVPEGDFMAKLDEMAELAFDDQCTGANPRYPLIDEIKQIYLKAYHGF
jgi:acetaldehyde dehydrogenase/alcohol dehydrogenase